MPEPQLVAWIFDTLGMNMHRKRMSASARIDKRAGGHSPQFAAGSFNHSEVSILRKV